MHGIESHLLLTGASAVTTTQNTAEKAVQLRHRGGGAESGQGGRDEDGGELHVDWGVLLVVRGKERRSTLGWEESGAESVFVSWMGKAKESQQLAGRRKKNATGECEDGGLSWNWRGRNIATRGSAIYTRLRCRGAHPQPGSSTPGRDARLRHCLLSAPAGNRVLDSLPLLPTGRRGACGGCHWPEGPGWMPTGWAACWFDQHRRHRGFSSSPVVPSSRPRGRPLDISWPGSKGVRSPMPGSTGGAAGTERREEGDMRQTKRGVSSRTSSRRSVGLAVAGADRHCMSNGRRAAVDMPHVHAVCRRTWQAWTLPAPVCAQPGHRYREQHCRTQPRSDAGPRA